MARITDGTEQPVPGSESFGEWLTATISRFVDSVLEQGYVPPFVFQATDVDGDTILMGRVQVKSGTDELDFIDLQSPCDVAEMARFPIVLRMTDSQNKKAEARFEVKPPFTAEA